MLNRREFCTSITVAGATLSLAQARPPNEFKLNYILSSCMYGYQYIGEILPEVRKTGAAAIDIWPKVHGNQREQLQDLGEERFRDMLAKHDVSLGCITQYALGPFGLQEEMRLAKRFGANTIVCGAKGPKDLTGFELKAAIKKFAERMKPHLEVAEQCGVTIAIENHANSLVDSPDSLKYLAELRSSKRLGIALAPYHLPQDEELLSDLVISLGDSIAMFYAWQHGKGCMQRLPKHQELLQMPGRGQLNFAPILSALQEIKYSGWTSIFMHPVPRGIPILETVGEVTDEINRARHYLQKCL